MPERPTRKVPVTRQSHAPGLPYVFSKLDPAVPTAVYDSYWTFAAERQAILLRRTRGEPAPWTSDTVLQRHKFTNAYRACDRVSQYLITNVIYGGDSDPQETVFRILLFKLFNKIETWELLARAIGSVTWRDFDLELYAAILSRARASGHAIYSGAYIMPSGGSSFGSSDKHRNHLSLISLMMKSSFTQRLQDAPSLGKVYELLRGYPTLGPFLAFQLAIDLNYSPVIDFDEMSFVVPGPGARDGIAKCFSSKGGLDEVDIIKLMADRQEAEFAARDLHFERLGGRRLQLIDCQNLFCEVDKYARVVHPSIEGLTGRTRIKQIFEAHSSILRLWFPPKWGINHLVKLQTRNDQ